MPGLSKVKDCQGATIPILNIPCGKGQCILNGSVCAKHSLMFHHVLCNMWKSMYGVIVVNSCSTALPNSSLLWHKCTATNPLIRSHRVVWCGNIRTKCWYGQLCRCWWAMVNPGAYIISVQNVMESEDKMWRSSTMLSTSPVSKLRH